MTTDLSSGMNILFAGTPEFAALHLQALISSSQHNIIGVYTQPDRPSGRGKKLTPSPVKALAQEHNIPVYQPLSLKSPEEQQKLAALNPDVMVVVAYGLLLPTPVLDAPTYGCINVHGSILPRWRGAAPIQRAIEAGDQISGVTIMQMDEGLDTGDMLVTSQCSIDSTDTAQHLHDKLAKLGPPALFNALESLLNNTAKRQKQDDSQSCYAKKIHKTEGQIDWSQSAQDIDRKIRAFNPAPICYTDIPESQPGSPPVRLKIYRSTPLEQEASHHQDTLPGTILISDKERLHIQCGTGILALQTLQLPGKKPLDIVPFMNGAQSLLTAGTVLSG